jgi:hypothetical protein
VKRVEAGPTWLIVRWVERALSVVLLDAGYGTEGTDLRWLRRYKQV